MMAFYLEDSNQIDDRDGKGIFKANDIDDSYDDSSYDAELTHNESIDYDEGTQRSSESQTDSHFDVVKTDKESQTDNSFSIRVIYYTICAVCVICFICHPDEFLKFCLLVVVGYVGYLIPISAQVKTSHTATQTDHSSTQFTSLSYRANYVHPYDNSDSGIREATFHSEETSKRIYRRDISASIKSDKSVKNEKPDRILSFQDERNYIDNTSFRSGNSSRDSSCGQDKISSSVRSKTVKKAEKFISTTRSLPTNKNNRKMRSYEGHEGNMTSRNKDKFLNGKETENTTSYIPEKLCIGKGKSEQTVDETMQKEKSKANTKVSIARQSCKSTRNLDRKTVKLKSSTVNSSHEARSYSATFSHNVSSVNAKTHDSVTSSTRDIPMKFGSGFQEDKRNVNVPTWNKCSITTKRTGKPSLLKTDLSTKSEQLRKSASFPKVDIQTYSTQSKNEFKRSISFNDRKGTVRLTPTVETPHVNKRAGNRGYSKMDTFQNHTEKQISTSFHQKESSKHESKRKPSSGYDEIDGIGETLGIDVTQIDSHAKESTNDTLKNEKQGTDSKSSYDEIDGMNKMYGLGVSDVNLKVNDTTEDSSKTARMSKHSNSGYDEIDGIGGASVGDDKLNKTKTSETVKCYQEITATTRRTEVRVSLRDNKAVVNVDASSPHSSHPLENSQMNKIGSTQKEFGVLSDKFLSEIAKELGKDWEMFFYTIGLTEAEVDRLHMDNPFKSETRNLKALLKWRCKNKEKSALEQLNDLLQAFNDRGREDLIDKYCGYLDESQLQLITAFECAGEPEVNILSQKLMKIYHETQDVPLSPIQEGGDKLPIQQLFSSVVIREDSSESRRRKSSKQDKDQEEQKEVKSPQDLLSKDGELVPRVFMLGDAAHGKTTYCMWLLRTWCNVKQFGLCGTSLNEWENALNEFDFVFHLQLRHVDPSRANVTDMICDDILGTNTVLQTAAKHVLSNDTYRCFIMLDGLDEWKPSPATIDQLKYKGIPNIDGMSNCVIFTTMRPWKFPDVAKLVQKTDRVIQIKGLDDRGIEAVIRKVLVHYYKMSPDTLEYEGKYQEMIKKLEDETLKSFVKIPLLAVVCVQIWYEGDHVGDSLTSFYIAMVNMLIERAHIKHQTPIFLIEKTACELPQNFSSMKYIRNFFDVLLKLGKVAYQGLLSQQMKLVFQEEILEEQIGETELKFALEVGLISQNETRSITKRKVILHFFHKSVQEFLAAIFIVFGKEATDIFCEHLTDIKSIMELSNVITFICGICPSLGSVISQHVVNVSDSDKEICKYRKSPEIGNTTVKELYRLQISWYKELQYGQTENPVAFHVSDICLFWDSDKDTVNMTRKILSENNGEIRSLLLWQVPTDKDDGICNIELKNFLCNTRSTRSLVMLYISGYTDRTVPPISIPTLRSFNLYKVSVPACDDRHCPLVTNMDLLQSLQLWGVNLGDRDIGLTGKMIQLRELFLRDVEFTFKDMGLSPHMSKLKTITLWTVNMPHLDWERFVQSLTDIHHQFEVKLDRTEIDEDSITCIRSSEHFSVTRFDVKNDSMPELKFTRVWPLKHDNVTTILRNIE